MMRLYFNTLVLSRVNSIFLKFSLIIFPFLNLLLHLSGIMYCINIQIVTYYEGKAKMWQVIAAALLCAVFGHVLLMTCTESNWHFGELLNHFPSAYLALAWNRCICSQQQRSLEPERETVATSLNFTGCIGKCLAYCILRRQWNKLPPETVRIHWFVISSTKHLVSWFHGFHNCSLLQK